MTVPSRPASVPSPSPRPAGMPSCRSLANYNLGHVYYAQGDYRRAIDVLRRTMAFLDGRAAPRALRQGHPACRVLPCLPGLVLCRAWGRSPRAVPVAEEGVRIAEAVDQPCSLMPCALGMSVCWPSAKGTCQRQSPCSNGAWRICQERATSGCFSAMAAALGAAYALAGRVAEAVPLLDAGAGAAMAMGVSEIYQALCARRAERGYLLAGRLEEAQRPGRQRPDSRPCAPGTWQPGLCPPPPRRDRQRIASPRRSSRPTPITSRPSPWPRNSACARSQAHCHRGLGTLYCQDRSAESRPVLPCLPRSTCTAPWT